MLRLFIFAMGCFIHSCAPRFYGADRQAKLASNKAKTLALPLGGHDEAAEND